MKGYYLNLYDLLPCELLKIGKVNYKIKDYLGNIRYIKPEKFCKETESVCVVWMLYKGIEGSYRIERKLYLSKQRIANKYPHQALVWEDAYGILNIYQDPRLI